MSTMWRALTFQTDQSGHCTGQCDVLLPGVVMCETVDGQCLLQVQCGYQLLPAPCRQRGDDESPSDLL